MNTYTTRDYNRDFIGEEINGWLLLEELEPLSHNPQNAMDKYRARQFKAVHIKTGFINTYRLHTFNKGHYTLYSESKRFKNRVGEVYGTYQIVEFMNDRLLIDKREEGHLWRALCFMSGHEVVMNIKDLKAHARKPYVRQLSK